MKETKYITLLDFEISRIFQYKISADKKSDCESIEDFLTNKGHNLSNCEWMVHDIKEFVDTSTSYGKL